MIKKSQYKFVLQKKNYDCGVAAVASILLNAGIEDFSYRGLGKELKLSRRGVTIENIRLFFSKYRELKPKAKLRSTTKDLKRELKNGRLAIVAYQSWGKEHEIRNLLCGHYSVAVKIFRDQIYLLDPSGYKDWGDGIGWRVMDLYDFRKMWIDIEKGKVIKGWMLTIRPIKT